jgi:hypothetical protein
MRLIDIYPSCLMLTKRTQNPRIVTTLVPELDSFRIFFERVEHIRTLISVALQSNRFTVFVFAGELE